MCAFVVVSEQFFLLDSASGKIQNWLLFVISLRFRNEIRAHPLWQKEKNNQVAGQIFHIDLVI
jgi:hypothetical protein